MAAYPGTLVSQSRVGVNRTTGKLIYGWEHCLQSMTVLFTTSFRKRVMRLDFGSNIPNLVDRPSTATVIMQWYVAIVDALTKWEPGFVVNNLALTSANADGSFTFDISGTFYPRGHLGDYSLSEPKTASIPIYSAR